MNSAKKWGFLRFSSWSTLFNIHINSYVQLSCCSDIIILADYIAVLLRADNWYNLLSLCSSKPADTLRLDCHTYDFFAISAWNAVDPVVF